MEKTKTKKKMDAIIAPTLTGVIDKINNLGITKNDVVNVFQNDSGSYMAVFYC